MTDDEVWYVNTVDDHPDRDEQEMLDAARADDEGEMLTDIEELMMAGYSLAEARYRLGYDITRGERTA